MLGRAVPAQDEDTAKSAPRGCGSRLPAVIRLRGSQCNERIRIAVLRISGEETAKVRHRDAWGAADDTMLSRIARASMEQLAVFLTSPDVAPGTSPTAAESQVAMAGPHESSPEAAGIFRVSRPQADPISADGADVGGADSTEPMPLPRRRPPAAAALSERETVALAASSR